MTLVARNINEELYKQFKAEAIRRGLKVSEALEEAMRLWLQKNMVVNDPEAEKNYKKYNELENELMKKYHGKYVVIAKGKFIGAFDNLEEVSKTLAKINTRHAIVTKMGEEEVIEGEWWGGSIKR